MSWRSLVLVSFTAIAVITAGTCVAADKCNRNGERFVRIDPAGVTCKRSDGSVVIR